MCSSIIRRTLDPVTGKQRDKTAETTRQATATADAKVKTRKRVRTAAAGSQRKKNIAKFSANVAAGGSKRSTSVGS